MESSGWPDGTCFAEVLAREEALLAAAHDAVALTIWRTHLVAEVTNPQSHYASALRQAGDSGSSRAGFLETWGALIARALERVIGEQVCDDQPGAPRRTDWCRIDAERTAVLVLAAVHGGVVLSRLSLDDRPVEAALDLALARVLNA